MEPYTRVKSLGFLIDTALMMSQMLPERKRKIAELAKGLVLSAMPGVGSASLHVAGNGASLLLACPALKMFLAPVWDAFPKVDMETGMVPMTQVLHEALGEFTLEQIDRWCLIARWRPEAHVTLSMAELVLGSVETGIRDTIFSDASGGSKRSDGWGGVIYFPDGTRREFSGAFDVHEQGFIH